MNATAQHTPFREDRQFGEPYADNEQVYRSFDLTNAQLRRLPMWAQLAIARADADIINLLAALEALCDEYELSAEQEAKQGDTSGLECIREARAAIARATGG